MKKLLILAALAALQAGDRVYEENFGAGQIFEIYPNKTALIKYDHTRQDQVRPLEKLAKSATCHSRLCVGMRVADEYGPGRVKELFRDGTAIVDYDHTRQERPRPMSKLKMVLEGLE